MPGNAGVWEIRKKCGCWGRGDAGSREARAALPAPTDWLRITHVAGRHPTPWLG